MVTTDDWDHLPQNLLPSLCVPDYNFFVSFLSETRKCIGLKLKLKLKICLELYIDISDDSKYHITIFPTIEM